MYSLFADDEAQGPIETVDVDVASWVEAARNDPVRYRDRQVTEIVLAAIGLSPSLRDTLVLKGGALMALAFKSERVTGDVDFTAQAEPEGFAEALAEEFNAILPKAAVKLGYLDLICRVQTIRKMPRPQNFADHDFPALRVRIASAARGGREEQRLAEGAASRIVDVEISFRDQVHAFQNLNLTDAEVTVHAFTIHEIVAEKLRALLQQPIRDRYRRQDVYDIAFLLETRKLDLGEDRRIIHKTLIEKCRTRGITPTSRSFDDPEIARRAKADWETLSLELGDLPEFEDRFALVRAFYISLPWDDR
jgi:predicted nucleotidyltransferase component of viral defense system